MRLFVYIPALAVSICYSIALDLRAQPAQNNI
jgi:hypothetical protein